MPRHHRRPGLLLSLRATVLVCVLPLFVGAQGPTSRLPAVYTAEQAERGSQVYGYRCVACHNRNDYANPDFRIKWNGQTAYALFERIRSTMPDTDPGSFGLSEYLDVTAYILKLNGLPAGGAPFAGDSAAKAAKLDFSANESAKPHHYEVAHALPSTAGPTLHQCCARFRAASGGGARRH